MSLRELSAARAPGSGSGYGSGVPRDGRAGTHRQRQDISLFHRSFAISMFIGARAFSCRVLGRNLGLCGPAGGGCPQDTPPLGGRSEVTRHLSAALPRLFSFWSRESERKQ